MRSRFGNIPPTHPAMLVKKDPSFLLSYLEDSSNLKGGYTDRVVIPENVRELASVLKEANSGKIPVTISGAGTGQAGGRIPFGGIVLSLEKLNAMGEIKKLEKGGSVRAEAGVIIKDLKESCERKGLFYTYDPTEQAAFLGGTIATNAQGARAFRYGPTRRCVKALTVVLASGEILKLERGAVKAKGRVIDFESGNKCYKIELPAYKMPGTKNSAGYYVEDNMDLIDLFIGQEGTLGVIAEAELELPDKPKGIFACFAFFEKDNDAWNFAACAGRAGPLSVEYFDANCLRLLQHKYGNVPLVARAAIFFEDEITLSEDSVLKKWDALLSRHDVSQDNTWVATSENMCRQFLEKRRYIPEEMNDMARRTGFPKVSTDLAVPRKNLSDMLKCYSDGLGRSGLRHFVFGHIGDAHLHVNMLPSGKNDYNRAKSLQLDFVKKSVSLGGTVSAEHGIGKTKKEFLKLLYGEEGVKEMKKVKLALDPNFILGIGNLFD
ncbi:MAG: FAD-binding oxidoreductase [Omnitrophica bacterium]|nr:FAD-binding oxidoreductase [Candidatus Omnitrophota bacterium]